MKRVGLALTSPFGIAAAILAFNGCRAIVGIEEVDYVEAGMNMAPPGNDAATDAGVNADANPTDEVPDAAFCVSAAETVGGGNEISSCASCCITHYTPSYNQLIVNAQVANANCFCNAAQAAGDDNDCERYLCGVDGGAPICQQGMEQGAPDAGGADASMNTQFRCEFCTVQALVAVSQLPSLCENQPDLDTCTGVNHTGTCAAEALGCLETCGSAFP